MGDDIIPITTARSAAHAALAPGALAVAARRGRLTRLRRGAYAPTADVVGIDEPSRHRLLIRAARAAAVDEPVFSHESAAVLHGIPILGEWPGAVVTTTPYGGHPGPVIRYRRVIDPRDAAVTADGCRVTSPARTAVDLAARRTLLGGIVAISHVRNAGVSAEELDEVFARLGPVAGIARARRAFERSTAGSESPLESIVVARCQDYGFEPPEQQRRLRGIDGREYRIDFSWSGGAILGEADGRSKYSDAALRGGRTADEVLWEEKQREDALRPGCERFLRFGWDDAWRGVPLARRLDAVGVPRTGRRLCALTF